MIRNVCKNLYVSHLLSTAACVGAAAFSAEPLKQRKYSSLVGNIVLSRGSIHLGVILSTLQPASVFGQKISTVSLLRTYPSDSDEYFDA